MQPSNQIQQESTSGPPPPPAPQSSTTNLNTTANQTPSTHPSAHPSSSAPSSKPFYKNKHSGAPPSGQGYKKNFHHSNTYGSSGSAAASSAGSYHGQTSYYMKSSHPRDRNQTATSGQTSNYDSYGGNYSKSYAASNNASGGNTSSTGTYDPYTKSKELGSTGSLTGSNSSNANSLSKSNSGATTGAPQSKGQHHHHHHHQSNQWSHLNQWKNPHRRNNYGGKCACADHFLSDPFLSVCLIRRKQLRWLRCRSKPVQVRLDRQLKWTFKRHFEHSGHKRVTHIQIVNAGRIRPSSYRAKFV